VIFPVGRLHELAAEGVLGGLTDNFFSSIGYNMGPEKFERTVSRDIAEALVSEGKVDMANGPSFWSSLPSGPPQAGIVRGIETIRDCHRIRRHPRHPHRMGRGSLRSKDAHRSGP